MKIPYKYHLLKVGDQVLINGKKLIVLDKVTVPAVNAKQGKITRYEFDDNYVLEFEKEWKFYQIKPWNFYFFKVGRANKFEIEDIALI